MLKKTVIVTLGCLLAASTVNVHGMRENKIKNIVFAPLFTYLSCVTAKKLFLDKNPNKNKILLGIGLILFGYCALNHYRGLISRIGRKRGKGPKPAPRQRVLTRKELNKLKNQMPDGTKIIELLEDGEEIEIGIKNKRIRRSSDRKYVILKRTTTLSGCDKDKVKFWHSKRNNDGIELLTEDQYKKQKQKKDKMLD